MAESFAPLCLPYFNSAAYLHAYIHYLSDAIPVVLLASHPDSFGLLSEARANIEATLQTAGIIQASRWFPTTMQRQSGLA